MQAARFTCCALALLLTAGAARADPEPSTAQPAPAAARGEGGSYVAAGVAFGLAAVGLGVGAVAGGISLSEASTVESKCQAGICPSTARDEASTARRLGDLSTASLIVGSAAALTGVVLLVVLPGPVPKTAGEPRGARWSAALGPGRLTLEARF
jgi:hypothetical protein